MDLVLNSAVQATASTASAPDDDPAPADDATAKHPPASATATGSLSTWLFSPQGLERATWTFLLLGVAARAVRYLLHFPLWEDECFVSINLADRSYAELMQPLTFHQVCPLLFLWLQKTIVTVLSFSEYALRLFPFACGLASLFLFRRLAQRLASGVAVPLAMAVFAVSYGGIRYAAEAKPYGSDMFVSLVLLTMVVEWWQSPADTRWLWGMTLFLPLAIGLSYPAVFVAGGVSLVIAFVLGRPMLSAMPAISSAPRISSMRRAWAAWFGYNVVLIGSFAAFFFLFARGQLTAERDAMGAFWDHTFPPLSSPLKLAAWMVETHTSDLLAYPVGGERGASTLTFLCCAAGLVVLYRARRHEVLVWALAPLALTFVAAALHRYPYGGHIRFNFYMAPIFCLLAGLGIAALWERFARGPKGHAAGLAISFGLLALVALGSIARDVSHPYKTLSDQRARAFAQWFWFDRHFQGEVVCLKSDLGQEFSPQTYHELSWAAMYLCNERIYAPQHGQGFEPRLDRVSREWPLQCVEYRDPSYAFDQQAFRRWLDDMTAQYDLAGKEVIPMPRYDKRERNLIAMNYVEVYKFVPKGSAEQNVARGAGKKTSR
jgi:hypothetical protein